MSDKIKIGILGSTSGTDLEPIVAAINEASLMAEIAVVISNREHAYILERARNHDIPGVYISHKNKVRKDFDQEMTLVLKERGVHLVLLIGFMRILSPEFCEQWKGRVLNVHPSLLPKYAGGMDMNIHEEVLASGDRVTGCTIHFVSPVVDGGPILIQKECAVTPEDTPEALKKRVQELEGKALIEAIGIMQKELC